MRVGEPFSPRVAWQLPKASTVKESATEAILFRTTSRASSSYPEGDRACKSSFKKVGATGLRGAGFGLEI